MVMLISDADARIHTWISHLSSLDRKATPSLRKRRSSAPITPSSTPINRHISMPLFARYLNSPACVCLQVCKFMHRDKRSIELFIWLNEANAVCAKKNSAFHAFCFVPLYMTHDGNFFHGWNPTEKQSMKREETLAGPGASILPLGQLKQS